MTAKETEIGNLNAELENYKKSPGDDTNPLNKVTDDATVAGSAVDVAAVRNLYNVLPD